MSNPICLACGKEYRHSPEHDARDYCSPDCGTLGSARRLWKYALDKDMFQTTIDMPRYASILRVDIQNARICLWAEVEVHAPTVQRTFVIRGTGHAILKDEYYVGTVFSGRYVWHVFEVEAYG